MRPALFSLCLGTALIGVLAPRLPARAEEALYSPAPIEEVRGIIRARDEAWISSELPLRITALPFREGDAFEAGDMLVAFDCAALVAQRDASEARRRAAETGYRNAQALSARKAVGRFEVELARAKLEEATAERDGAEAGLSPCHIRAPFSGHMGEVSVHLHEIPERSARMFRILDSSGLEADMIVPAAWLRGMRVGNRLFMMVEELGRRVELRVTRIAAAIDAASGTVKIVATLVSPDPQVKPGMSGPVTAEASQ